MPLAKAAQVVHRWPTWIPWVVFGGGFAVAGIGGFIDVSAAQRRWTTTTARSRANCAVMACDLSRAENTSSATSTTDARADERASRSAIMSVGVAATAVGGVMLFMNRGQHGVYRQRREAARRCALDYVPPTAAAC